MSLLNDAMEQCVVLTKTGMKPDGEGGITAEWVEGMHFTASFDFQTSLEAKTAEKQGVTGLWDIYVPKSVELEFHNVFKRLSDGQTFRVTSKDDKKTPASARLNLRIVSAEEWALT